MFSTLLKSAHSRHS